MFGWGWLGFLGRSIGLTKLWHVILDGLIEAFIIGTGAVIAFAAGFAPLKATFEDIGTRLKAVSVVSESLGKDLPPLTTSFQNLEHAMSPRGVELYGDALNVLNAHQGAFLKQAPAVINLFDTVGAKFAVWANAQLASGKLIAAGTGFLTQLAHIFGSLGEAIANLLRAEPGIARFLLMFLQGVAALLLAFSKLPAPVLEAVLAIHGIWVWGNLAAFMLNKMRLAAIGAATGLKGLALNPLFWVAVTAAGVAYLAIQMQSASKQAKDFIGGLEAGLSQLTASQAIIQISADIGKLNAQIQGLQTGKITESFRGFSGQMQAASDTLATFRSDFANTFKGSASQQLQAIGHFLKDLVVPGFAASHAPLVQAQKDIGAYNAEIVKLTDDQTKLFEVVGYLVHGQNRLQIGALSVATSFALMDAAGVKAGDSLDVAVQKIDGLVSGYRALVGGGEILANQLNAVTFQSLQQQSKIADLTGAWDAFFKTISGGVTGFVNFGQALNTMNQGAATQAQTLATAQGRVATATATLANQIRLHGRNSAQAAGAADRLRAAELNLHKVLQNGVGVFGGVNASSLTMTQNFLQAAQAAQANADSLLTLSSAAGLGAKGTALVTQGTKDMLQELLPAAQHSDALRTILYALAQQAGYTGVNSFKALATWVGKTKNPMQDLNNVTTILTVAAGNLTKDVQALSVALGRTLNDAMATAIFQATGGQKVFDDFATSVLKTGAGSLQSQQDAQKLADQLYALTGNVGQAHDEFVTFAQKGLGLTRTEAEALWKSTLPNLQKKIDSLHGKDIPVQVIVSGHGTVTSKVSGFATQLPTGKLVIGMASGGRITAGTSATADDVLARVSKGETIVSAAHSRKLAAAFAAVGVPGYSAGGVPVVTHVPAHGVPGTIAALGTARDWTGNQGGAFGAYGATIFAKTAVSEFQKAIIANALPMGGTGLPLGNGPLSASAAIAQAFAKSILWAYGWTQAQWPYEQALWQRESSWNPYAVNPTSGAAGIPQNINGWAAYRPGDYQAQVRWGDAYISGRYGTPARAWAHELSFGWYDKGGMLRPGMNLAWNGTGRNEYLAPVGTGNITIVVENRGVIGSEQQMRTWLENQVNWLARNGRLSYAIRRSPSAVH